MTTERTQASGLGPVILVLAVLVGAAAVLGAVSGLYAEELGSARVVVWLAPILALGRVLQVVAQARRSPVPGGPPIATGALVVISLAYVVVLSGVVILLARYSGGLGLDRTLRSVVIALVVSVLSALMLAFMLKGVESRRRSRT